MQHLRSFPVVVALLAATPLTFAQPDFVADRELREMGLIKFWQLQLPVLEGFEVRDVHLVDDQIYAGISDGYVCAVHADAGVLRWLRNVTGRSYRLMRPDHVGDQTFFTLPTMVRVFDRRYGFEIAKNEFDFPAGSAAVSNGELYFVGGLNSRIHTYSAVTHLPYWEALTGGPIESRAAIFGEAVFVASTDGRVYSADAATKRKRWISSRVGSIRAALKIRPDEQLPGIYVASTDRSLYKLGIAGGNRLWRAQLSSQLLEPPVVVEGTAFQYSAGDGLVAVNTVTFAEDERIRWKLPSGRTLCTVDDDFAYVFTRDARLVQVDRKTGNVVNQARATGFDWALPSPDLKSIYLADRRGRLFCARSVDADPISAERVREILAGPEDERKDAAAARPPAPVRPEERDTLRSRRTGPPVGGRSRVTREYQAEDDDR